MKIYRMFSGKIDRISLLRTSSLFNCYIAENHDNEKAFTLVELIVVMGMMGLLAAIALPAYNEYKDKAKIARCAGDINVLMQDIQAYFAERGDYPPNLQAVQRDKLLDPWGNGYEYSHSPSYAFPAGVSLNNDYDLYSKGKNGASLELLDVAGNNCDDDIIRASDGSYLGLGIKFFE